MKLAIAVTCAMIMASSAAVAQPSRTAPPATQPAAGQDPTSMPKPEYSESNRFGESRDDPGTTDGAWTPQSATALSQFQANRALPGTMERSITRSCRHWVSISRSNRLNRARGIITGQ